ncbi:MAG: DegV family protein [Candidatus Heimdallarchaeota archaeon]|nr:DegV family protein [Candidatus Heimdallarchaeota archaeon]
MAETKMKVIVDSTCDLPKDLIKKYDIDVVPVYIQHQEKTMADGVDITIQEYYDLLREVDELPTTSAPAPKDFLERIEAALKNHSSVFIATVTSKLSATFQSAKIAAKRIKDAKVHLIDSKFGSGVLAFLALAVAKLSKRGVPENEIIKKVEELRDESILVGYVETLDNFKKSGRISNLKFWLGAVTKAKPLLELKDGIIQACGKATGKVKAQKKVIAEVLSRTKKNQKYDIMITHGDDSEAAELLMKQFEKKLSLGEKLINYLTPALATHLGIGTVVISLSPSI